MAAGGESRRPGGQVASSAPRTSSALGRRAFGLTPEFATASKGLAANQGLYNGFLAAGLVWGIWLGAADDQLAQDEGRAGHAGEVLGLRKRGRQRQHATGEREDCKLSDGSHLWFLSASDAAS